MFVLALVLLAMPPAVSGDPIARQGPSDDESRGLGNADAEQSDSQPQTSRFDDPAFADQQILDDLIVDGSACVGLDCVNGESFGFDTIRLKENNLRIRAFDTSSTASFPTVDWEIMFNESSNGGANVFAINDLDAGRRPFSIEASAPSNSLYVDDGGRIGLGTNTPVTEIHVKDGDSPTLRLEQDGTSGFTPQTWDVAGNETNFFIRDATNGSKLPFRIRPNAPSNSIFVDTDGDIGLGTSSPASQLDIVRAGNVEFRLANTTSGETWKVFTRPVGDSSEGIVISRDLSGEQELRITPTGALVIPDAPIPTVAAGTIYFDGNTFCGYDGTAWRPLQAAGDQTCN
ncbi:hypothetical protein DVS28_a1731 [Euzebya pacifica]|uniref:Uncharacterized protein n=1 Tax=Euzebya pacifica TaxID=1608957 RepID=A0A346XW25_9ACTN|nr:hypothetical protein DVS28_a1731 [Euzebya pacifica]